MASDQNIFIERCPHDRENPYAQISRELIRDETLSMACRWMLIYLLSNKDGWRISVTQIWNHTGRHRGGGRDSVRGWINESIEAGYMQRFDYFEKGMKRSKYYLSEFPKFKKCLPRPETQDTDYQEPVNQAPVDHTYKEEHRISKDILNKKESAPKKIPKERFGRHVELTKEVYLKFSLEFGSDHINQLIENMNDYIDAHGKKPYKDYEAAIRTWLKRDNKTKTSPHKSHDLINKLFEKYPDRFRNREMEKTKDGIAFRKGSHYHEILANDPNFVSKLKNMMSNVGVSVDGI